MVIIFETDDNSGQKHCRFLKPPLCKGRWILRSKRRRDWLFPTSRCFPKVCANIVRSKMLSPHFVNKSPRDALHFFRQDCSLDSCFYGDRANIVPLVVSRRLLHVRLQPTDDGAKVLLPSSRTASGRRLCQLTASAVNLVIISAN